MAHSDIYAHDLGYGTVHSERGTHEPTILIPPSVRSHSSHGSSQRVAFAGNPGTHASTSAGVPRGVVSSSSRGDRAQPVPVMASVSSLSFYFIQTFVDCV